MSTFPPTSFAGNKDLCGEPLPHDCSNQTAQSQIQSHSEKPTAPIRTTTKRVSNRALLIIICLDAAAVLAIIAAVWWWCGYRKKRLAETNQKTKINTGGGTHYGSVGEMVVFEGFSGVDDWEGLRRYHLQGGVGRRRCGGGEEGQGEDQAEGGRSVAKINWWIEASQRRDELLLVYDFLSCGSLHSLLHGNRGPGRTPWEWSGRLKLASGAAQGLAFLHSCNNGKLHHGHLTSSNIIQDHLGNACVADIGIHHILPTPPSSSSSSLHNAYTAPELVPNNNNGTGFYAITRKYSKKCDVYSFGVILLEILTGKTAAEEGGESLVKWVEQQVVGKEWSCSEVLDIEVLGRKEMEGEMRAVMEVALLCLAESPRDRPKMSMEEERTWVAPSPSWMIFLLVPLHLVSHKTPMLDLIHLFLITVYCIYPKGMK